MSNRLFAAALFAAGLATAAPSAASEADLLKRIEQLEAKAKRADELEYRLGVQEDVEAVRRLQAAYNFYNSSNFTQQMIDMVSKNADSIEIGGQGVYKGYAGFVKVFSQYSQGKIADRPGAFGRVLFQVDGQQVITISKDRKHAWARTRVFTPVFEGLPRGVFKMNGGDYEQEYVKENGRWMIWKFRYIHMFAVKLEDDGKVSPGFSTLATSAADAPTTYYHPWPETGSLPFHYPNPVTGKTPPDTTGAEHYWIGNWPGEFGKSGHK